MFLRGTVTLTRGVAVVRVGLLHDCKELQLQPHLLEGYPLAAFACSYNHTFSRGRRSATTTLTRGVVVLRISLPHGRQGHGAVCRDSIIGIEAGWDL